MNRRPKVGSHVRLLGSVGPSGSVGVVVPNLSERSSPKGAVPVRWQDGMVAWVYPESVEPISERDYAIAMTARALTQELEP